MRSSGAKKEKKEEGKGERFIQPSSLLASLLATLGKLPGVILRPNIRGEAVTTFNIGGEIPGALLAETSSALTQVVITAADSKLPVRLLGNGSNLLIPDEGLSDSLVVSLRGEFKQVEFLPEGRVWAGAGVSFMNFSRQVAEQSLSGLEFAAGIPATIGGAIKMNAGAHGGDTASVLESVRLMHPSGEISELSNSALNFSYRHTELPSGSIILGGTFRFSSGDREAITKLRNEHLAYRKRTQPLTVPSAGSTFRNPSPELPAGKLIEELGLKGAIAGHAEISRLHANWITNPERKATAADVRALIHTCISTAQSARGVALRPEVIIW